MKIASKDLSFLLVTNKLAALLIIPFRISLFCLFLNGSCLLLLPLWESVIVVCFVVRYIMSILVCNHLDGEERAGCLAILSSWCLVMVERLILAVPRGRLRFVIVVFPDHTHLLILNLMF